MTSSRPTGSTVVGQNATLRIRCRSTHCYINQSQCVCCSNARSCLRVSRFGQECTCSLWCGQGSDNKARQIMAGDVARDGVSLLGLQQESPPLCLVRDACTTLMTSPMKSHADACTTLMTSPMTSEITSRVMQQGGRWQCETNTCKAYDN